MTDDLTETTDMSDNDTPTDEATPSPVDLLPVGDTDVLADDARRRRRVRHRLGRR